MHRLYIDPQKPDQVYFTCQPHAGWIPLKQWLGDLRLRTQLCDTDTIR